jgi:voltage-gated potassium channel
VGRTLRGGDSIRNCHNRRMYGERLAKWDRSMEWPLTITALAFFAAYALEILARLTGTFELLAEVIIWAAWGVFVVDYFVRLFITEHRWRWFHRHLLDLAIVLLPMLRPLRLMRYLAAIAIIQRGAGGILRGRVVLFTVGSTILIIIIAGLAIYDAERAVGNITSFGDAVWWAFVTITTVGYGEYFPVTVSGRFVAVGLMIGGITLIGVITATLASWIVERVSDEQNTKAAATEDQVERLRDEVAELKQMISDLSGAR